MDLLTIAVIGLALLVLICSLCVSSFSSTTGIFGYYATKPCAQCPTCQNCLTCSAYETKYKPLPRNCPAGTGDTPVADVANITACMQKCDSTTGCNGFSYNPTDKKCIIRTTVPQDLATCTATDGYTFYSKSA